MLLNKERKTKTTKSQLNYAKQSKENKNRKTFSGCFDLHHVNFSFLDWKNKHK